MNKYEHFTEFRYERYTIYMSLWDHQKALVETMAPKTDRIFWLTVSSVVSEICFLGSIFPVFFIASSFLFFLVSS